MFSFGFAAVCINALYSVVYIFDSSEYRDNNRLRINIKVRKKTTKRNLMKYSIQYQHNMVRILIVHGKILFNFLY